MPNFVPTSKPDELPAIAIHSGASVDCIATCRNSRLNRRNSCKCFAFGVWVTQNPPVLSSLGFSPPPRTIDWPTPLTNPATAYPALEVQSPKRIAANCRPGLVAERPHRRRHGRRLPPVGDRLSSPGDGQAFHEKSGKTQAESQELRAKNQELATGSYSVTSNSTRRRVQIHHDSRSTSGKCRRMAA